ncbi:hypothetical protein [Marivita sp. GX14005]|uniref:hypothetical protein n=1 Tax=Marivita sp. GX14005 TaxID=2942276 RepID=UPI0020197BB9|nr:hypothetical protein [Marivita sp. GX14005]MCL3880869.1 hypothetical protein [Marivita sp. GX14005]
MSDPVTSVEIEDVLSSIRKLVAEEARAMPPARKPSEEPDKLVLTPAQRVDEPADRGRDPVLLTEPVREAAPKPIEDLPKNARLSEFGDVEHSFPDAEDAPHQDRSDEAGASDKLGLARLVEEEVAAVLTSHDAGPETEAPDEQAEDNAQESDAATDEASDTAEIAVQDAPPWPPLSLEDKVAALGRLVARDSGEFEEERESAVDDTAPMPSDPMDWSETAPFVEVPEEAAEPSPSNVVHPQGTWPEPEQDIGETHQAPVNTMSPLDETEAEAGTSDVEERGADQPCDESQIGSLPIDEAQLRALVSDIVRQELQGTLGERITRNVRKLVRREIHRMLIAQELD